MSFDFRIFYRSLALAVPAFSLAALGESPVMHTEQLPELTVKATQEHEAKSNGEYELFAMSTSELRDIGTDTESRSVEIKDALVQLLPNRWGAGEMCSPVFSAKLKKPCPDGELLVSFVRYLNSKNSVPKRGTCYCITSNSLAAKGENPESTKATLAAVDHENPNDLNVFVSHKHKNQIAFIDDSHQIHDWNLSSVFVRDPNDPQKAHHFLNAGVATIKVSHHAKHPFTIFNGYALRQDAKTLFEKSEQSLDWKTKDGRFRDPYHIGIHSEEYKKDEILKEYAFRSVNTLGTEYDAFSLFHNAWKLSRLTRVNNPITLKQINELVKKQLETHYKDVPNASQIVARLMPKFEAFNKHIWESIHDEAQNPHPQAPDSGVVDGIFRHALADNQDVTMWNLMADIKNEHEDIASTYDLSKAKAPITLSEARKINEYKLPPAYADVVAPSQNTCKREFTAYNSSACPCRPKAMTVPCNLNLPSLKQNFVSQKIGFGKGKTYQLVNERTLPAGLRSSTFTAKRTGYSTPNNSPAGTEKAGFAAIRRMNGGKDGRTTLGRGTLESPITAAVSPAAAANFGVCQGDLLHDPDYGWLRIEGGCTSGGLGDRVDVWRGGVSTKSVHADNFLNRYRTYRHFPAGLVDAEYAQKNPK